MMAQTAKPPQRLPVPQEMGATGPAAQQRPGRVLETIEAGVTVVQVHTWPPDLLLDRGLISRKQHDAATYLREVVCMANRYMVWPEGLGRAASGMIGDDEPPTEAERDYYRRCAEDYRTLAMSMHPVLWRHVRAAVLPEQGGYWEPRWVERALGWLAAYWRFR